MLKKITTMMLLVSVTACSASFRTNDKPQAAADLASNNLLSTSDGNARMTHAEPIVTWWQHFDDQQLSELVEKALQNNLDIKIGYANLMAARAIATEVGYDRLPSADLNADYNRERRSEETATLSSGQRSNNSYSLGFDASWELDLFDRVSNRIKASDAESDALQEELKSLQVSIAAEVAKTYIELRGAQYRVNIAERNADVQQDTLELTRNLTRGGVASRLDIAQAETQLSLTLAEIPLREATATAAINRLSVLTGQNPERLSEQLAMSKPIPSLPMAVNIGNAAELLRERPDIIAAEKRLTAATANYNLAVADQFPAVNIVGSLGFIATNLSTFGSSSAIASAIGPSLSWGVFDTGRIQARIKQNDAKSQAALANYQLTVLKALEETKTAISDFAREEQRRERLQDAARTSTQAESIATQRFELGDTDFLPVLDSQRTRLNSEDSLAVSETQSAVKLISIYKSLGKGWRIDK